MSRIFMHTRTSPSAVASLKHVVESRLDLMPSNRPPAVGAESAGIVTKPPPAMPISGAPPEPGNVHINTSQPVQALGTTQCCEELLFGKNRTTSSPGFSVCNDIGITYAKAVHKYQQYSNVSVGANVTLVPTFHKRTPMVVSMSCPQLNLQQVVTSSSVPQNNTKFGPNHTVCAVEVLAKLTPFVKQCCETYMRLPRETVEDLREDGDMPVATCKSIEHCFAHDKANGVNAYVAKHTFSLDTAILNTHAVSSRQRAGNAGTGAAGGENAAGELTFPLEQKITVYLASLFGGAVADQHA
ncbi:hypothetical protein T484DRAFT_1756228 [Baffinella frigidus]|nr:hypothetical protein T484DRAFT_1756228 [Cryptophyta sp. CCMP2293]